MAISPSGRSDVYWVDGKLQIGDDCCPASKSTRNQPHSATRISHSYDLNTNENPIKVAAKTISGKDAIDIRVYQHDKWGGLNPTKNGVTLTLAEYKRIKALSNEIDNELDKLLTIREEDGQGEEVTGWHPLSDVHVLRVGVFISCRAKHFGVDFHELKKTSSGELKPTGKGLTISKDDWEKFKQIIPEMESKEGLEL